MQCTCEKNVKMPCCNCSCQCRHGALDKNRRRLSKLCPTVERYDYNYLEHKRRVKTMLPAVDSIPPKLNVCMLMKVDTAITDLTRMNQIMQQNKTLLTRMNIICRTKGVIDTYNRYAGKKLSKLHKIYRILDTIELANNRQFERILKIKPVITNADLSRDWQKNLQYMRNRAIYPLTDPWLQGVDVDEDPAAKDCMDRYRPKVFLDLAVKNGRSLGRLKILLYSDIAPLTCQNFLQFISADGGGGSNTVQPGQLLGCPINRIYQKLFAEINVLSDDGRPVVEPFQMENLTLTAQFMGTVAMIPNADDLVDSNLLITFKPLPILNGKRAVFGRIVKGLNVMKALEGLGRQNGEPREKVIISNCGIIRRMKELNHSCICLDHMKSDTTLPEM